MFITVYVLLTSKLLVPSFLYDIYVNKTGNSNEVKKINYFAFIITLWLNGKFLKMWSTHFQIGATRTITNIVAKEQNFYAKLNNEILQRYFYTYIHRYIHQWIFSKLISGGYPLHVRACCWCTWGVWEALISL